MNTSRSQRLVFALLVGPLVFRVGEACAADPSPELRRWGEVLVRLQYPDHKVRLQAIQELGRMRPVHELNVVLLANLQSFDDDGAFAAVEALGAMGPDARAALPGLVRFRRRIGPNVSTPVWAAVGKISKDLPVPSDVLMHYQDQVRNAGIALLQKLDPSAQPVPVLRRGLKHELHQARQAAAWALGRFRPEAAAAVPDLIVALRDPEAGVRAAAALALGEMGDPCPWQQFDHRRFQAPVAAVPFLLAAHQDPDPNVRFQAASAVLRTVPLREETLDVFIAVLRSDVREHHYTCLATMEFLGPRAAKAADALAEFLRTGAVEWHRCMASLALAEIGPEARRAMPALIHAWESRPAERPYALRAMAALSREDPAIVTFALDGLKQSGDLQPDLRREAIAALGKLGATDRRAVPTLIAHLSLEPAHRVDPTTNAQRNESVDLELPSDVIPALGEIGSRDERAMAALFDAAKQGVCRKQAMRTLAAAAPSDPRLIGLLVRTLEPATDDRLRFVAVECLEKIAPHSDAAVRALALALNDKDSSVLRQAYWALGRLGPAAKSAIPDLIARMDANQGGWFDSPAYPLSLIGEPAVPALIEKMKTSSVSRGSAAGVLREIGPAAAGAVPQLVEMLQSKDENIRGDALSVLETIGPKAKPAIPVLLRMMKAPEENWVSVTQAFVGIGPSAAPALAEELHRNDPETFHQALGALEGLGPQARDAAPELAHWLKSEDPNIRLSVAILLAQTGLHTDQALPVLRDVWQHGAPREREDALRGLGYLAAAHKTGSLRSFLQAALTDPDTHVRHAAVEALTRMGADGEFALPLLAPLLANDREWTLRDKTANLVNKLLP